MLVAELPFDVVEVKLAAPQIRPGTVAKADVMARLCASRSPFATVVAPAGYGKTTLLARWAEADPRPFAWVALDAGDDDALVLLRHIAAAIDRVEPVGQAVFEALSGAGGFAWTSRVPRVGSALAKLERALVLVLDDLHAVANPACLDAIAALIGYAPAGSQIAIASREAPELPLARWRARGLLDEIGVSDLRLDEQEAGLLLEAAGVELEASALTDLTERTEGWPAGLYLAALSLQAGAPSAASAAGFGGDDQFVSEYFRLELLSRLPPDEARFLQYTSVLDRMCGGLCDAVLQTARSAQTLETLARTNGFVVPLDRRGEWYRYHHLFRELLRKELERNEPHVAAALNRRAMAWCVANDLTEPAVLYGQAAGDYASTAVVHAATARVALHEARHAEARSALARAHRLRPMLDHGMPWMAVEVGLELTRAHLALAEAAAARTVLAETERVLELRPLLGTLVEEARELRDRVAASSAPAGAWAMSLTAAELRLLPYLATHLTFPEIADRLFISRNTAKTEAVAIYRKFGVSSRSQAIERAIEVGLVEDSIYPPRADFVQ